MCSMGYLGEWLKNGCSRWLGREPRNLGIILVVCSRPGNPTALRFKLSGSLLFQKNIFKLSGFHPNALYPFFFFIWCYSQRGTWLCSLILSFLFVDWNGYKLNASFWAMVNPVSSLRKIQRVSERGCQVYASLWSSIWYLWCKLVSLLPG